MSFTIGNTNTYTDWWKSRFDRPTAWPEAVRASSAYFWQEGADGVCFFNLFDQRAKRVDLPEELTYGVLKEVGDPAALAGKDKMYAIQPTADSGFCLHGSEATPLPIPLDKIERKLPLMMGPDANDSNARFDRWLRSRDPASGVRSFEALNELAEAAGLTLLEDYPMPANNRILAWQRQ